MVVRGGGPDKLLYFSYQKRILILIWILLMELGHGFYLCYLLKKCVLMVLLIDRQTRHRGVEML